MCGPPQARKQLPLDFGLGTVHQWRQSLEPCLAISPLVKKICIETNL